MILSTSKISSITNIINIMLKQSCKFADISFKSRISNQVGVGEGLGIHPHQNGLVGYVKYTPTLTIMKYPSPSFPEGLFSK